MFKGTFTALVTPFKDDQTVDEEALRNLIQFQIENGVEGIVLLGTTGESPTVHPDERKKIIEMVVQEVGGKIPVIVGTGTNCTEKTIEKTKEAKALGADACLVVTPYYNKPTQKGIKLHFEAVADVGLPVMVYNIKGRSGVNIETDTMMELAKHPHIIGVKEASGDLNQMKQVIDRAPDDFSILSGDDGLTLELIKLGGHGIVSVASNAIPKVMSEFVRHALAGELEQAEKEHETLNEFFENEFIETNPIPIKTALALTGKCKEVFRLPMCTMEPETRATWQETLKKYNLI